MRPTAGKTLHAGADMVEWAPPGAMPAGVNAAKDDGHRMGEVNREAVIRSQERRKPAIQLVLTIVVASLIFLPLGIFAAYWSITSQLHEIHEAAKTAVITPEAKPVLRRRRLPRASS